MSLETLEARVLRSVAPDAAVGSATTTQAIYAQPMAAPTLTLADRQELLNNWIGSNKTTLANLLAANNLTGFDNELLSYMVNRTNRHYFFDIADASDIVSFINGDAGLVAQKNTRIAKADANLAHKFPEFVNSSTYTVQYPAGNIDWINQPSSSVTTNTDFRNVLNRHIPWIDLAMAYRFTGNAAYATELRAQLDSWSKQYTRLAVVNDWNKPSVRPKWDLFVTSQRTDNWLYAYHMMLGTAGWTAYHNTMFLHRLFVQADFMRRVSNGYELTNNKATGHATALYNIALLFPEYKNAADWETYAQTRMFDCLVAQFRIDGVHYEQSPGYHGGSMSGFFDSFRLASINGKPWGDKPMRRLRNAIDAFYQLLSPDGTQAALSDTYRSNGLTFFTRAAIAFNETRWPKGRPRLDDCWQLGVAACTPLLTADTNPELTTRGGTAFYGTSGYYVTRSGEDRDARQLIFDAGPKGGIHGQYDLLNFELYGYGKPLIADPGLLSYGGAYAAQREQIISTPAHNTIHIDGKNHAASEKSTVAKLNYFARKPGTVFMTATHYAYQGLAGSPVVARSIYHDRNDVFLVVDFANAGSNHTYATSFNFATTATTAFSGGVIRSTTGAGDVLLQPLLLPGQTVSTKNQLLSNTAPDAGSTTGRKLTITQTSKYAVFGTLMVAYDNGAVPDISAQWLKMPTASKAGQIQITKDGVPTIVYFALPDLTPVAGAAAQKAGPAAEPAIMVQPLAVKWSAATIEEDRLWD